MPQPRPRPALILCLLLLPTAARAEEAEADIPTVGRPADLPFSGASGAFRVRAAAAPTTLEAEKPLTLTLTVEATAPVRQPPRRIDLREVPAFKERFDFLEGGAGDDRRPDDRTWQFVYRLQPKREDVKAVPGVPFVFFNPDIQYPRKGFQVAYTDPIGLTVAPPDYFPVPVAAPERILLLAPVGPVLRRREPWAPPGVVPAAALFLALPALCVAWFLGWRRLYPDAARRARQRRSLAARRALQALRGAGRLPPSHQAAKCAEVTAEYLRARFDAAMAEPTPAEAAAGLLRAGRTSALAEQAAAFFRACDAVRFGPPTLTLPHPRGEGRERGAGLDLPEAAAHFILAVEAEKWSASHS